MVSLPANFERNFRIFYPHYQEENQEKELAILGNP